MEYIRKALHCASILTFLWISGVQADAPSHLSPFIADVPVASQSVTARSSAAELGLLDVLVRVSGSENVRYDDEVLAKTSSALRYVEQFEYMSIEQDELLDEGYRHLLRLQFSERLVKRLLSETDHKFWSISRPKVLVWLVEDSVEHGKQMMGSASESDVVKGLLKGARYRGIPIEFPLMDFQDQVALGVQALWDLDEQAIMDGSERYRPEVILVGKYTTTSSGATWSNWQFFYNNDSRVYDLRGDDQSLVGSDAITPLADFLAQTFAVKLSASDTEYYFAKVTNIRSYGDYRGLLNAVSGLDAIGDVQLDRVHDHTVEIRFKSEANVDQLTGLLALSNKLVLSNDLSQGALPAWQRSELGSSDNPLLYQWAR
jgi:hypothetical protein